LTVKEGLNHVQRNDEEERGIVEISEKQPRKRAAPRCSIYSITRHTARTCSQRTGNSL
jgi:hypothetical protein